jgi:RNA exonuclease 1
MNLDAQLTALHAALPARTAFLLFSGHSDPRAMSALAARRTQYQASQNQKGAVVATAAPATAAAGTGVGGAEAQAGAVRWSTADERALEEAVARARMGLLFVGVKP